MKKKWLILLAFLIVTACDRAEPAVVDPTAPPVPRTAATAASTLVPTSTSPPGSPQATIVPSPTPPTPTSPSEALSPDGPWWVFFDGEGIWSNGLWAVNADGSGLTRVLEGSILRPRHLGSAVSPVGGFVALITATDPTRLRGLALNIVRLPDGQIRSITPLASIEIEPAADADPALRPPEPLVAIVGETSLAWSPDGQQLAFIGAQDGPSADLYSYSLREDTITRLTDGPSQGIRPSWSPYGKFIVHMGVNTLGSGAGYDMTGVWAARADDTGVRSLYDPSGSGDEVLVGWRGVDTFAVYTLDVSQGGNRNLRAVNVETGIITSLWGGFFNDVVLDPQTGNMILLVNERAAEKNPDGESGVFFMGAQGAALRILAEEPVQAAWSAEAGLFLARTEFGLVAISSSGEWNQIHDFTGGLPAASPVANELAWYGADGLWIGNLISSLDLPQPERVFTEPVRYASWRPDGDGVLFVSGENEFFVARRPDWDPELIRAELDAREAVWVFPAPVEVSATLGGPWFREIR